MQRDPAPFEFPREPDWTLLDQVFGPTQLLRMGAKGCLQEHCRGKLAYLATPFHEFEGGPVLAAAKAERWMDSLALVGLIPVSPAVLCQQALERHSGWDAAPIEFPEWPMILRQASVVVVPPMDGWAVSLDVWHAVCAALRWNMPVFILGEAADNPVQEMAEANP